MSMESFEQNPPIEPIDRTVARAMPLGMEDRSAEEIERAVETLDSLLSDFERDKKIEYAGNIRFFVKQSTYADFAKQATALGLPIRFVNSYLDTKGVKLSKPNPAVLRPKLALTGGQEKTRKKATKISKDASVDEPIAKTSVEPSQQDMFGFE